MDLAGIYHINRVVVIVMLKSRIAALVKRVDSARESFRKIVSTEYFY